MILLASFSPYSFEHRLFMNLWRDNICGNFLQGIFYVVWTFTLAEWVINYFSFFFSFFPFCPDYDLERPYPHLDETNHFHQTTPLNCAIHRVRHYILVFLISFTLIYQPLYMCSCKRMINVVCKLHLVVQCSNRGYLLTFELEN